MLTAEARIQTERPSRYLVQLCRHADSEENLQRIQSLITRNLERFGRRDHLNVNWQRPQAPAIQAGDAR